MQDANHRGSWLRWGWGDMYGVSLLSSHFTVSLKWLKKVTPIDLNYKNLYTVSPVQIPAKP